MAASASTQPDKQTESCDAKAFDARLCGALTSLDKYVADAQLSESTLARDEEVLHQKRITVRDARMKAQSIGSAIRAMIIIPTTKAQLTTMLDELTAALAKVLELCSQP